MTAAIIAGPGAFSSDQEPLDPKNPVTPVPGRHSHGPFMIQIGAAAALCRAAVEDGVGCVAAEEHGALGLRMGLLLIEHCLTKHTNLFGSGQEFGFTRGSMWEFIDDDGLPYVDPSGGAVISDPGHALEFVGLAGFFLREAEILSSDDADVAVGEPLSSSLLYVPPIVLHFSPLLLQFAQILLEFSLSFRPGEVAPGAAPAAAN